MIGHRKMAVFFASACFLLAGLFVCRSAQAAATLYPTFATGIATAAGVFTWGNVKAKSAGSKP